MSEDNIQTKVMLRFDRKDETAVYRQVGASFGVKIPGRSSEAWFPTVFTIINVQPDYFEISCPSWWVTRVHLENFIVPDEG